MSFTVKDSGAREQFCSGMVRDTQAGKTDYFRVLDGPMLDRWAVHLTRGATKYPDVSPGVANWLLANGDAELARFRASAFRHFLQWMRGDVDEDHAAAVFFNINGAEYVRSRASLPATEQPRDAAPAQSPQDESETEAVPHGHGFGFIRKEGHRIGDPGYRYGSTGE